MGRGVPDCLLSRGVAYTVMNHELTENLAVLNEGKNRAVFFCRVYYHAMTNPYLCWQQPGHAERDATSSAEAVNEPNHQWHDSLNKSRTRFGSTAARLMFSFLQSITPD